MSVERDEFDRDRFVEELVAERLLRGMSWRQVAGEAGVDPSTLSRLARGATPDLTTFARLVRWMGVPVGSYFESELPGDQEALVRPLKGGGWVKVQSRKLTARQQRLIARVVGVVSEELAAEQPSGAADAEDGHDTT